MKNSALLRKLIRACADDERTLRHESEFVDATRAALIAGLACERRQFVADLERFAEHMEPHDGSRTELSREAGRDLRVTAGGHDTADAITACRRSRARTEAVFDEALKASWPDAMLRALTAQWGCLRDEAGELDEVRCAPPSPPASPLVAVGHSRYGSAGLSPEGLTLLVLAVARAMLRSRSMKTIRPLAAALLLAAVPMFGCTNEPSRGPAQQAASPPAPVASPMGATERQPPSPAKHAAICEELAFPPARLSSPGAQVGVQPDGTPVRAEAVPLRAQMIELPTGAVLTSRTAVNEINVFPEELPQLRGPGETVEATVAVRGVDRRYASNLSYGDMVGFFDWSLATYGFQYLQRTTTSASTLWSVRCGNGEMARVAVRQGTPPTVEVIEANERASR